MDAIQKSMDQMMQVFGQRMAAFEERQGTKSSLSDADPLASEFAEFKAFVMASLQALQAQIGLLTKQVDQQEMRGRRKILLLHGLQEEQKENTSALVVATLVERLKLVNLTVSDLVRCHRMGRATSGDKPRPILFKLRDDSTRGKIWSSKTSLKGTGISLSEFLTKMRHDVYMAARQKYGITKCWTMDGFVFVIGPDGTRHRVSCNGDLAGIVTKASKPSTVMKERAPAAAVNPPKTRRPTAARK